MNFIQNNFVLHVSKTTKPHIMIVRFIFDNIFKQDISPMSKTFQNTPKLENTLKQFFKYTLPKQLILIQRKLAFEKINFKQDSMSKIHH